MSDVEERFWAKVNRLGPDDCWEWLAGKDKDGYGKFSIQGKSHRSHRVVYSWYYGVDLNIELVCHTCDNPSCVNPLHLFLGSPQDNMSDKVCKGRQYFTFGELNGCNKLTEETALQGFLMSGTHKSISDKLGVSRTSITLLKGRKTWAQVTEGYEPGQSPGSGRWGPR